MEKREALYTVGGDINWCCHCGKHYGGFSKKTPKNWKQNCPVKFHSWYVSRKKALIEKKDMCTLMFIAVLFTIAKIWKQIHMSIHIRMDKEDIVYIYWRRKWQSTQYSCLENPVDRGAWRAAVHGVAQSWTRLKRLSMNACIGEGNSNLLQCSCLENPRDRGAWWAAIYGVVQSWTWLKQNSSSSSSSSVYIIYTLNTTHP